MTTKFTDNAPIAARGCTRVTITGEKQWHALRRVDVTASVAAALFGEHDFMTARELFDIKRFGRESSDETPAMRRGRLLEPVIGAIVREERPDWKVFGGNRHYYRDPDAKIGATPDFFFMDEQGRSGIIQGKSVAPHRFRQHWRDSSDEDAATTAPLGIVVQTIIEAVVTGVDRAFIGALIVDSGIRLELIEVAIDRDLYAAIKARVAEFWQAVEDNVPPEWDYKRDGAAIDRAYASNDGPLIDLTGDNRLPVIVARDKELSAFMSAAKKERDAIKNELRAKLAGAAGASYQGGNLTAKWIQNSGGERSATSYTRLTHIRVAAHTVDPFEYVRITGKEGLASQAPPKEPRRKKSESEALPVAGPITF